MLHHVGESNKAAPPLRGYEKKLVHFDRQPPSQTTRAKVKSHHIINVQGESNTAARIKTYPRIRGIVQDINTHLSTRGVVQLNKTYLSIHVVRGTADNLLNPRQRCVACEVNISPPKERGKPKRQKANKGWRWEFSPHQICSRFLVCANQRNPHHKVVTRGDKSVVIRADIAYRTLRFYFFRLSFFFVLRLRANKASSPVASGRDKSQHVTQQETKGPEKN